MIFYAKNYSQNNFKKTCKLITNQFNFVLQIMSIILVGIKVTKP